MRILVEYQHGQKRSPLDVSPFDSVEFLRYQLYSLTGVPPARQVLTGLTNPRQVVTEHMQVRQLALAEGQRIIVTQKMTEGGAGETQTPVAGEEAVATAAAASQPARVPVASAASGQTTAAATSASSSTSAAASPALAPRPFVSLDGCCSRSFFGEEALAQPSAMVGSTPICYACAQTCHMPGDVKGRVSMAPIVCGCCDMSGRECLFGVRAQSAADRVTGSTADQLRAALRHAAAQINQAQLAAGQQQMQARIGSYIRAVLEYENPEWQAAALRVIPLTTLQERAQAAITAGDCKLAPRDALMDQLLHWFKHEFFTWTNAPPCDTCGAGTSILGGDRPNASEAPFRPGMVEVYKCASGHITRFPRYNHALKLLETRRGRCGEWAQAFTLCCRALGYEARTANDHTDHIWTEYYSEAERRWIHADSCESRRDAPLLYEAGWGKKLTYVIACSKDEVVDVTRRYTRKWSSEVLERRTSCPEQWLATYCASLSQMKLMMLPPARQAELTARRAREEAEFAASEAEEQANRRAAAAEAAAAATAASHESGASAAASSTASASSSSVKAEEHQGRTTGSVEWRAARGELGADELARARALNPTECAAPAGAAAAASSLTSQLESTKLGTDDDGKSAESKRLCSTQPTGEEGTINLPLADTTTSAAASSVASSAASAVAPSPPSAASQLAAAKARTAALFRLFQTQVSVGCGASPGQCGSAQCKSNSTFTAPSAPAEIAKLAIELTKAGPSKLCPRIKHTAPAS